MFIRGCQIGASYFCNAVVIEALCYKPVGREVPEPMR
jgi:hypothetical protein